MIFKLRKKIIIILAFLFLAATLAGFFNYKIKKADALIPLPFGGRIIAVVPCTNGILVTVSPPWPGMFMFEFAATVPFAYYQFYRPGPAIKGTYFAGGSCILPPPAPPIPAMGTMIIVGTSLF